MKSHLRCAFMFLNCRREFEWIATRRKNKCHLTFFNLTEHVSVKRWIYEANDIHDKTQRLRANIKICHERALSLCCSRCHDLSSSRALEFFWRAKVPAEFTCHRLSTRRREMHCTRVRRERRRSCISVSVHLLNAPVGSASNVTFARQNLHQAVPLCAKSVRSRRQDVHFAAISANPNIRVNAHWTPRIWLKSNLKYLIIIKRKFHERVNILRKVSFCHNWRTLNLKFLLK